MQTMSLVIQGISSMEKWSAGEIFNQLIRIFRTKSRSCLTTTSNDDTVILQRFYNDSATIL